MKVVGKSIQRKEAWDKVTGTAKYTADFLEPGTLHAKLVTSTYAHAKLKEIDINEALNAPGVRAIVLGRDYPKHYGVEIKDHPPLAVDRVRYFGEPIAIVVANSERDAMRAVKLVKIEYEFLAVINSPSDAVKPGAAMIHENLDQYQISVQGVYPEPNTNICNRVKIRKGDMTKGWSESEVVVEENFTLPKSDHIAMETRCVQSKILADGSVEIITSSQSPFSVKEMIAEYFGYEQGKVNVKTPLVGGGFGGKSPVQLEFLAVMASRAVGGKPVKIANSREEDIVSSPSRLGAEATIKIGASRDGLIRALEMTYLIDSGAYSDITPRMTKAIAIDCSGPYNIENLTCDSICVYTNSTYSTSFRGFGHETYTFCIERALDKLAFCLSIDPLELRLKNALIEGQTTPTLVRATKSNIGDLRACILKLKEVFSWDEGLRVDLGRGRIKAKGMSCFWKTSNSPTDAVSSVLLTFNTDGSININSGVVEIGPGMKTTLAQILAEKMQMNIERIHVKLEVDTTISPKHWKTVGSMTTYMAGRAVLKAADDLIDQLRSLAASVMRCSPEDLVVAEEKVYLKQDPNFFLPFKDLVHGFKYPNGNAVGGQIMGRGSFIMENLTFIDKETGEGKPGPAWAVGAQAVEIELDTNDYTYRLIKAATIIDAGKVLNPKTARGVITGGMCMGLGLSSREAFQYDCDGKMLTTSLRTYKMIHIGEEPEYIVEFIETPHIEAPYKARGIAEHGIIGIPAALANALSSAASVDLNQLPITPELIWRTKTGGELNYVTF